MKKKNGNRKKINHISFIKIYLKLYISYILYMNNILKDIKIMRKKKNAPVDLYGAYTFFDKNINPKIARYHVLIALILSSQSKDETTNKIMTKLVNYGLTIDNIKKTKKEDLYKIIRESGIAKKKASYIKKTTEILSSQYNNDIPNNFKDLIKLSGVGPKIAILTMNVAWNKNCGISVDTHVHRVSNRIGLVKTKTPNKTREKLEELIPKKQWKNINPLLVGFGQQICTPRNPKCDTCKINKKCKFYNDW
jgi:endonuclease III